MKRFVLSLAFAAMMMGTVAGCSAVVSVDDDEATEVYMPQNEDEKKNGSDSDDD